ncbi:hypothetical protein NQ318_008478 [Aromia moschata]|uniref:Uncharacterized protein n=1 Tax=Aromia moschata TaxID=1265417 RepID=A0AAV8YBH8_9CUCU|nr:hypothetical protein NQ318_008478 [Aromia moschata]
MMKKNIIRQSQLDDHTEGVVEDELETNDRMIYALTNNAKIHKNTPRLPCSVPILIIIIISEAAFGFSDETDTTDGTPTETEEILQNFPDYATVDDTHLTSNTRNSFPNTYSFCWLAKREGAQKSYFHPGKCRGHANLH